MMTDPAIAARRRALFDRIVALPDVGLASMEAYCDRVEGMHGVHRVEPGTREVDAGATITHRPDLMQPDRLVTRRNSTS